MIVHAHRYSFFFLKYIIYWFLIDYTTTVTPIVSFFERPEVAKIDGRKNENEWAKKIELINFASDRLTFGDWWM